MTSGILLLQCLGLNLSAPLTWPTWGLVICALLKRRESRRAADHRLVALLQLVSAGLLAAQMQGLLASVLQLLTVISALAGLLAHELGGVGSLPALLRRSLQLLVAALPLRARPLGWIRWRRAAPEAGEEAASCPSAWRRCAHGEWLPCCLRDP